MGQQKRPDAVSKNMPPAFDYSAFFEVLVLIFIRT